MLNSLPKPILWVILALIMTIFLMLIISKKHRSKKTKILEPSSYLDLIKWYRERYGDAAFEITDFVKEIQEKALKKFCLIKTPQEIINDLKQISVPAYEDASTDKDRSDIWLIMKTPISIHPLSIEIGIYQIVIKNNWIYFSTDIHSDSTHFSFDSYDSSNFGGVRASKKDIDRKCCTRYVVLPNTLLNLIAETAGVCYDCHYTVLDVEVRNEVRNLCVRYVSELNSLLSPYKIHTELTEKSWNFFYDNSPITLEKAIRILPNEVLHKKVIMPSQATPEVPTPPQSQPRPSTPGVAQNAHTTAREPILVFAPYIVDYIITQFIDSDFCFDEVLGVPDEVRKDLTKYTAIGAWVDEKDPLMRYMEVCNNDITFHKILKSPVFLSFKITEKEKYQIVHFSMIVAVDEETSKYMLSRPAPMYQLDDADYKRLEQSLLLRRQDIEDKYNVGNFQDYVERVKIGIPLKTSPEAPTPPQSQPKASPPPQRSKPLHRLPRPPASPIYPLKKNY